VLAIGIVAFAVALGVSVILHEAGHMATAKAFGMRVRRFFVGFGPRLFSFRIGATEYGFKIIPAGGFCDIAGMTALDEVTPEEAPRAMWRYPVWKRVVVLSAGSIIHFVIAFLILYFLALSSAGLPNISRKPVINGIEPCAKTAVKITQQGPVYRPCGPASPAPAKDAGLHAGDVVISVAGEKTSTWPQVISAVQRRGGATPITVRRDGRVLHKTVNIARVPSAVRRNGHPAIRTVGELGVGIALALHYGPLDGFAGAGGFTSQLFQLEWQAVKGLPHEVTNLVHSLNGGHRSDKTPVSVIGATRIGGELVQQGAWGAFWVLLAEVNYVIGVLNLLPLLPLDGGHIAVTCYEKLRDWLRRLRGLRAGGPVDYTKLTGVTVVVIVVLGAFFVLTLTADIVSPITLPGG
jgi:membrane-associated protease RseP (regulator of RpoE activity)